MHILKGKKILLGITGSIAAYKACELIRLLVKNQAEVQVVLTEAASHFVGEASFEALTRRKVAQNMWDSSNSTIAHIDLVDWADLIVVAPATANFIAKLRNGICDDLLSSLCAARKTPIIVAPAMNCFMWDSPANLENVEKLQSWPGVSFSGPEAGIQACGDNGKGRLKEPAGIAEDIIRSFYPKLLSGKKVLITAGPTFEALDPVRGITNSSSGKQGYSIASACSRYGAEVLLVSGPVHQQTPAGAVRFNVTSAEEMKNCVMQLLEEEKPDVFISVAAVADYRPAHFSDKKIKKENSSDSYSLELTKNPDILSLVGHLESKPLCIGFAAETNDVIDNGRLKLQRKGADLIVANPANAINSDSNDAVFITKDSLKTVGPGSKEALADTLVLEINRLLKDRNCERSN